MITFRGSGGDRQGSTSLCRRSQGAAFAPRAPAPLLVVAGHDPRAAVAPTCPRLPFCAPRLSFRAQHAGTSTYLPNTNVPFSHPSDLYPQKNGRKVRWCWKSTFTFRRAPDRARTTRPARIPAEPAQETGQARRAKPAPCSEAARRSPPPVHGRGLPTGMPPTPSGPGVAPGSAQEHARRTCNRGPETTPARTDLDAEVNRSRRGTRPISVRK